MRYDKGAARSPFIQYGHLLDRCLCHPGGQQSLEGDPLTPSALMDAFPLHCASPGMTMRMRCDHYRRML